MADIHIDLLAIDMETGKYWLDPSQKHSDKIDAIRQKHRDKWIAEHKKKIDQKRSWNGLRYGEQEQAKAFWMSASLREFCDSDDPPDSVVEQMHDYWDSTLGDHEKYRAWDESAHPREPAGGPGGGQFAGGGGGDGSSSSIEGRPAHPAIVEFEPNWAKMPDDKIGEVQEAIQTWVGEDYEDINYVLRSTVDQPVAGERLTAVQGTIKGLDEAFQYAKPTDKDYLLYRGLGVTHRGEKPWAVGDEFQDKGFISTTPSKVTADTFAESNEGYVVEITIPKGSRVVAPLVSEENNQLDYGDYGEATEISAEPELLLPRGSKFKIIGSREDVRVLARGRKYLTTIYEARLVT